MHHFETAFIIVLIAPVNIVDLVEGISFGCKLLRMIIKDHHTFSSEFEVLAIVYIILTLTLLSIATAIKPLPTSLGKASNHYSYHPLFSCNH